MQRQETAEVQIIKLLKTGPSYVSGQDLSAALGISRTAVWKHIKALRQAGYSIEAVPSKGYRLKAKSIFNGIEIASSLKTEFIGKKIFYYPEINSTNVKAFELGRAGEPEGTAVIADSQSSGKGRIGRKWESPPGVNLYTSILLRPEVVPQNAHNLTFVTAVAAAETVAEFSGMKPTVKWPNDILLGGKKTAGILMEMDSEADRVHFVIAGIGVNVNMRQAELPEAIKNIATSIAEVKGEEVDRAGFARGLFTSMEKWYKRYLISGFDPIMEAWKGFFDTIGRPVKVTSFSKIIEGVCSGVDRDGALLVNLPDGKTERVISGDVETVR